MKISIITINYNNAIGLEQTIQSVVAQTFPEIEYIIIDGGSSDGSVEIIKQYEQAVSFWISEPDGGIYNAMNKGIEHASGNYCLFLNSGDHLYDCNVLDRIINERLWADVVVCDMLISNQNSLSMAHLLENKPTCTYIARYNPIPHPATLINRGLFENRRYHEEYKICSDWIFFYEVFTFDHASYQRVHKVLSVFYKGGISSTGKGESEFADYLSTVMPSSFVNDLCDENGCNESAYLKNNLAPGLYKLLVLFERMLNFFEFGVIRKRNNKKYLKRLSRS